MLYQKGFTFQRHVDEVLNRNFDEVQKEFKRIAMSVHAHADYLKADGTVVLTADWLAGADRKITAGIAALELYTQLKEQTAAPGNLANYGRVYVKTDGHLYFKTSGGTEYALTPTYSPPAATSGLMHVSADVQNDTQTMASITGLSFSAAASKRYAFDFVLQVYTDAYLNGIHYSFSAGVGVGDTLFAHLEYNTDATTRVQEELTAFNTASTAAAQATTKTQCRISGHLKTSGTAGTIQIEFCNEESSHTCKILAGSWGIWHQLN